MAICCGAILQDNKFEIGRTDNIELFCSSGPPILLPFNRSEHHYFPGIGRGNWTGKNSCPPKSLVCGVRIQSEPFEDMGVLDLSQHDNTAINNVEVRCKLMLMI